MNSLLTSGLLAASMLIGQTSEPPSGPVVQRVQVQQAPFGPVAQAQTPARPIMGWWQRDERPLITKIQTWWKREPSAIPASNIKDPRVIRETTAPPITNTPPITTTPSDFPRKMPNPQSQGGKAVPSVGNDADVQPANMIAMPKNVKYPIQPLLLQKIGRDEKFEWITGQLEIENGNFVVYYATPETVDKYNGRIVLLPQQVDMNAFKKGDLVSVRGQMAQRQTTQGIMPVYRLTHASLIERLN